MTSPAPEIAAADGVEGEGAGVWCSGGPLVPGPRTRVGVGALWVEISETNSLNPNDCRARPACCPPLRCRQGTISCPASRVVSSTSCSFSSALQLLSTSRVGLSSSSCCQQQVSTAQVQLQLVLPRCKALRVPAPARLSPSSRFPKCIGLAGRASNRRRS